jgi:hypothetical protein
VFLLDTPIITTYDMWQDTVSFSGAQEEGQMSNLTFRLFYCYSEFGPNLAADDTLFIYPKETIVDYDEQPVLMARCNPYSSDGSLAINYKNFNPFLIKNNSIIDNFFNVKLSSGHTTTVPLYLPNEYYSKLKNNTRFKMNDDLYQIQEVKGFDPLENNETQLILIKE